MARKRPLPAEDPPPASSGEESSGEEEEEEEEEEERESGESKSGSESDDEDDNKEEQKRPAEPKPSTPPSPPPPNQPLQKSEGGSSSTESGSESESESRRNTVKPTASKPMETVETPPAKKLKPEPSRSSKQPTAKRKVKVEDSKKGVKKKDLTKNESLQKPGDESKKPMFQRIWGENDEIALLQGMIEFRERKGLDPPSNTSAFHRFVKKSLGHEFTDNQLASKMRVLKKKYSNNEGKVKDGKVRVFSRPHERKVFELSMKIWGVDKSNETGNKSKSKSNGGGTTKSEWSELEPLQLHRERPKDNGVLLLPPPPPPPFEHKSDPVSMLSCDKMLRLSGIGLGLDDDLLKKGWEMVGESKRVELKERWKKLHLGEVRLLAERAELIQYQSNLILQAWHQATSTTTGE